MKEVENFYRELISSNSFDKNLKSELGTIRNEKEYKVFIRDELMPIAKSYGYDFSVDDVLAYERDRLQVIAKEKRKRFKGMPVIKKVTSAFMSLLLLMGSVHTYTKAMLSREVIVESVGRLTGKVPSSAAISSSVAHEGMNETSDVSSQSMSKPVLLGSTVTCGKANSEYVMSALNLLDPYALKISGFVRDLRLFDGNTQTVTEFESVDEGRVPKRKWNADEGVGSPNYMRTLFPSSAGDLSTSGGSENFARFAADCKPTPELVARIAAYFYKFRHNDQDTMMKDLNKYEKMLDTVSAVTDEKLLDKFYDMIGAYVSARRAYDEAVEKHDAVVCKPMTASQYLEALEKEETEYMIADDLLSQIKKIYANRNHIEDVSQLNAKTVLKDMKANMSAYGAVRQALAKDLETNGPKTTIAFEKFVTVKFKKNKDVICAIDRDKERYHDLIGVVGDASKEDDMKKTEVQEVVKKNPKLLEVCKSKKENLALEGLYEFFRSNNLADDVTKESLSTNDGIKNAKAILKLLKEGTYMIKEQESDSDKGTSEKYPKYTTERMLMSYFIEYFEKEDDVKRFYDEIDRIISDELVPSSDLSHERLNKLAEIIHNIPKNENIPYTESLLISNGSPKMVSTPNSAGEVIFSGNFADCADTAVRHFLNLLFYCKNKNWSDVLPDGVSEELKAAKEAVITAIDDSNKKAKFLKLKDRVKIFFAHQTPNLCNDESLVTRTLWTYVISNMTDISDAPGFYSIKYVKGKNHELETGYINMLKLIYNIEKALYGDAPTKSNVLNVAHDDIEKLCHEKNYDNLVKAIESIIHVVKHDVKVELDCDAEENPIRVNGDDIYGAMNVTLNISDNVADAIKFIIDQTVGHSAVNLFKLDINQLDMTLTTIKKYPLITAFIERLLGHSISESCDSCSFYDVFKAAFERVSKYSANSNMLRLLRDAYSEEENYDRLSWLKRNYFSPNMHVSLKRENDVVNLSEFFESIFRTCELKRLGIDIESAKPSEDGNYKYIEKGNGVVEIYPNVKLMKQESLEIPAGIGGCNKYIICASAFQNFVNLKTLTFADSIESVEIGDEAFGNSGIEKLIVPRNVKEFKLGVGVFKGTEFETLEISDRVQLIEIGKVRFKDHKLDTIVVPEDVTELSIPSYAFYNIVLPDTLTIQGNSSQSLSVGSEAFGRKVLDSFIISRKLPNVLGVPVFIKCMTELLGGCFTGSISELEILAKQYPEVQSLLDRLKELERKTITLNIFGFGSVTLEREAFTESDVSTLNLSEGLQRLNLQGAFQFSKIKDFVIPSSVKDLTLSDYSCIRGSESKKLLLSPNVERLAIGYNVFNALDGDEVVIPAHVKYLELYGCFSGSKIKILKLEDVKTLKIEDSYCCNKEFENINLNTVESLILGICSFTMYKGTELVIPENVKDLRLSANVFADSNIKTLTIMPKLEAENIADNAFAYGSIEKIIVHDEESRKLLDENRAKYGIADTVQIELAPTTTLA